MLRIHFKGGPWSNTEDEILKAGIASYGLNNWERIASLIERKTALQCRERWENYLDPRLRIREEWTEEEEERLVQLATLFPEQWNLVSQQMGNGRTAWLCEERYASLLDKLNYLEQEKERASGGGSTEPSKSLEEFMRERKRRREYMRGHETKAARADAVDADDYHKEMLETALSRIANQDGKKGLRKERKAQLEQTSFLTKLESNREAMEAGTVSIRTQRKINRAIREDRIGARMKDTIREDGDDDDDDELGRGESDAGDGESEADQAAIGEVDEAGNFIPIDVSADKAAAGVHAKRRKLVKDLKSGKGSSGAGADPDGVSVNFSKLEQLITGSDGLNEGGSKSLPSRADTEERALKRTKVEQRSSEPSEWSSVNLGSLFADLPTVVESSPTAPKTRTRLKDPDTGVTRSAETYEEQLAPLPRGSNDSKPIQAPPSVEEERAWAEFLPPPVPGTPPSKPHPQAEVSESAVVTTPHWSTSTEKPRDVPPELMARVHHTVAARTAQLIASGEGPSAEFLSNFHEDFTRSAKERTAAFLGRQVTMDDSFGVMLSGVQDAVTRVQRWRNIEVGDSIEELRRRVRKQREQLEAGRRVAEAQYTRIAAHCFREPMLGVTGPSPVPLRHPAHNPVGDVRDWMAAVSREEQRWFFYAKVVRPAELAEIKSRAEILDAKLKALAFTEAVLQQEYRRVMSSQK